jgi:hypothetical protein
MRGQPLNEMRLVFKRRSVPLSYPLPYAERGT